MSAGDDDPESPGIPMAEGDAEEQRAIQEAMAQGVTRRPKGPKPLLAASGSDSGAAATGNESDSGSVSGSWALPPESDATGFEPDPADRVGARKSTGLGSRIGPATAEDAWMWQGVPPGRALIRRYRPGERRYYMGDNNGPSLKELPPAWPPGQGPDA